MTFSAILRELVAAGLQGDHLVAAMERIEASSGQERSLHAEAQARYRNKKKAEVITGDHGDHSDDEAPNKEGPQTPKETTSSLRSEGADAPFEVRESKQPPPAKPTADPKTEYFRRMREVCGKNSGGLAAKLLRRYGDEDDPKAIAKARARIEEASTKADPAEWLGRVVRGPPGAAPARDFHDPLAGII